MHNIVHRIVSVTVLVLWITGLLMAQGTTFTLLHVNDTHSHLDAFGAKDPNLNGTIGGIAKAATIIGTVKASEPNVILLHAGDAFQGDAFFNTYFCVPEFQIMMQLGFDAMAVGNHEFGYGPGVLNDVLTTAFADASFPLLSANLDMSGYPALEKWIRPSIVKTVAGVKIGIFGMTVPGDPTTIPAPVVISDQVVPIAQQQEKALRDSGAAVVILLSHLGSYLDQIVAAGVTGIDFIVGGHDHYLFEQPLSVKNPAGKTTLIFQAGDFYRYIGELHFSVDNNTVTVVDYHIIPLDASVPEEPATQGIIESLKEGIVARFGDLYHTQIATATHDLEKKFDPKSPFRDTPMGNLVTDAFRLHTGTDIGFTAIGLISEKLYAGPIVGADVFRSMSYGLDPETGLGFKMATFAMRGSELRKGLELSVSQLEVGDDLCPQVSGMTFKYNPRAPVGHRIVDGSIRIGDRPCIPIAHYTVTSNAGLPGLLQAFGIQIENLTELPEHEFTLVENFISSLHTVDYSAEGRIHDMSIVPRAAGHLAKEPAKGGAGKGMHLLQNIPNPFNPVTHIQYQISDIQFVSMKVYDMLGREVATLVNETEEPGTYTVRWDASDVSSGMYFCRLVLGSQVETRKMLLTK